MKTSLKTKLLSTVIILAAAQFSTAAYATPIPNGLGSGVLSIQTIGNNTTLTQNSIVAKQNWTTINTSPQQTLNFVQPTNYSIIFNKVTNGQATQFLGKLTANGRVIIQNQAGITFAAGSQVNIGALVATTANNIVDCCSVGGYRFSGMTFSPIYFNGTVNAAKGGYVNALGNIIVVGKNGVINAPKGHVNLVTGQSAYYVTPGRDSNIGTDNGVSNVQGSAINILGNINAKSGYVAAVTTGNVIADSAINLSGVIDTSSLVTPTTTGNKVGNAGIVVLSSAGRITDSGTIKSEGLNTDGSKVGGRVTLASNGNINVKGDISTDSLTGVNGVYIRSAYGNTNINGTMNNAGASGSTFTVNTHGTTELSGGIQAGNGTVNINSIGSVTSNGYIDAQGKQPGSLPSTTSVNGGNIRVATLGNAVFNGYVDAGAPQGNAGNVALAARGNLTTNAKVAGNNVTISAGKNIVVENSAAPNNSNYITAYNGGYPTGPGTGGTIAITAGNNVDVSTLLSSGNTNSGGKVTIVAKNNINLNAPIVATSSQGVGGNITLKGKTITNTSNSSLQVGGANGNGTISGLIAGPTVPAHN